MVRWCRRCTVGPEPGTIWGQPKPSAQTREGQVGRIEGHRPRRAGDKDVARDGGKVCPEMGGAFDHQQAHLFGRDADKTKHFAVGHLGNAAGYDDMNTTDAQFREIELTSLD